MRKKVFVSFDYENDRRYKFLLEAWNDNGCGSSEVMACKAF